MNEQTAHPIIHCLVYGEPGSGKTTFAATFPKPILWLFFDGRAKNSPLLPYGQLQSTNEDGTPLQAVMGNPMERVWNGDQLQHQVEYYHEQHWEVSPSGGLGMQPIAYELMVNRLLSLDGEVREKYWGTVVIDSLTYLEMAVKSVSQFKINTGDKYDARHHGGFCRQTLDQLLLNRFAAFNTNLVLIAHEKEYQDDFSQMVRCPNVVGSLGKILSAPFSETYRLINNPTKGRYLQTQKDHMWPASTSCAPNPCTPTYDALWSGVQK